MLLGQGREEPVKGRQVTGALENIMEGRSLSIGLKNVRKMPSFSQF